MKTTFCFWLSASVRYSESSDYTTTLTLLSRQWHLGIAIVGICWISPGHIVCSIILGHTEMHSASCLVCTPRFPFYIALL